MSIWDRILRYLDGPYGLEAPAAADEVVVRPVQTQFDRWHTPHGTFYSDAEGQRHFEAYTGAAIAPAANTLWKTLRESGHDSLIVHMHTDGHALSFRLTPEMRRSAIFEAHDAALNGAGEVAGERIDAPAETLSTHALVIPPPQIMSGERDPRAR